MEDLKYKCSNCGKEPEPDKEKSTENWEVYDTKCKHCGGEIELDLESF